ncbi:NuA4 histone acetyltransferase subunit [Rhizopus stolonifer]|uniref:NuA4 histone acetyltransferase subunit n=1 Tax=Rhizopus stolonifer TaxID=4846 RepID=A0A367KH88_RHIST|nr:NuA4 histone acetyltransferase subunit [Rhizopus stolonifer]
MVVYGGDEVNALVLDIGTSMTRAGYAGEDTPRVMFPTSVGYIDPVQETDGDTVMAGHKRQYYIGDNKVNMFKSQMEIKHPLQDGLVEDWDAYEAIWHATFDDMLRIRPEEHPLLCTEPAWNTKENREKMIQLALEKFDFPAFYLAPDAVMTAFSVGRATALVLDSGAGVTSAVPVYDGFVLKKGILHQSFAGNMLAEKIKEQLKTDLDYTITPRYKIAKKTPVELDQPPQIELRACEGLRDSFDAYQTTRVINEYKETVCQVSDVTFDEGPKKLFEFPDGYQHQFGLERYKVPELLFQPHMNDTKLTEQEEEEQEEEEEEEEEKEKKSKSQLGVHELVYNSINSCDIDLRPLLFNNIVVTGGNTLLDGFNERLHYELPLKAPGSKIKIHAAGNATERKSSSWLGGSILASLGTFHQLWISRHEYQEYGASVIHRKC